MHRGAVNLVLQVFLVSVDVIALYRISPAFDLGREVPVEEFDDLSDVTLKGCQVAVTTV